MFLESLGCQQFTGSMGGCPGFFGAVSALEDDGEPGEADRDPGMVDAPLTTVGFGRPAQHLDGAFVVPRHRLGDAEARLETAEVDTVRPDVGVFPVIDLLLIDTGCVLEAALAEVEIGEAHGDNLGAIGLLSSAPQFLAQNLDFELHAAVDDLFGVIPARLLNEDLPQTLERKDHHSDVADLLIGGDGALILLLGLGITPLVHAEVSPKRMSGRDSRVSAGEAGAQPGQGLPERVFGLPHFPQAVESVTKLHEAVTLVHRSRGLFEHHGDRKTDTAMTLRLKPVPAVKGGSSPLCGRGPLVFQGTKAQEKQDGDGDAYDQKPIHDVQESDVRVRIFSRELPAHKRCQTHSRATTPRPRNIR